ncbi:MAG: AAC(3) family N-acetyltransferase [Bacteroidota bacterium]|nr:AAC(3) family N-acetyltransferase [Bacteroidota bacterium]
MINELKGVINSYKDTSTVLIHSDLYVSSKLMLKNKMYGRTELLEQHFKIIHKIFPEFNILMPAFNYDFFTTHIFDTERDKVQLGPFPEYFRTNISRWRTPIPIFSFCGNGKEPKVNFSYEVKLYDNHPVYHDLLKNNGIIFHYGTNLWATAFIHFIESYEDKPLYRYDKAFYGKVIDKDGNITEHKIILHVRPHGNLLINYNLCEIQTELLNENIMKSIKIKNGEFYVIPCKELLEFLKSKIAKDPFYLLHKSSREWVEPKVEKLGRRFHMDDFENVNE